MYFTFQSVVVAWRVAIKSFQFMRFLVIQSHNCDHFDRLQQPFLLIWGVCSCVTKQSLSPVTSSECLYDYVFAVYRHETIGWREFCFFNVSEIHMYIFTERCPEALSKSEFKANLEHEKSQFFLVGPNPTLDHPCWN